MKENNRRLEGKISNIVSPSRLPNFENFSGAFRAALGVWLSLLDIIPIKVLRPIYV